MRYGSVCSGIEAASVAWGPLGFRPAWFAEIAPFPSKVLAHHYPETPNHGSLVGLANRLTGSDRSIDLLVGGTPCQSFSVAGLRGGLADERGNLALEFARLAAALRPRWLLWENVPGVLSADKGGAFASLLRGLSELGYGLAWRVLDAQFFGLAQRRQRVFLVGHLGAAAAAGAVLFEPEGVRRNPPPRKEARQETATPAERGTARGGGGGASRRGEASSDEEVAGALDTDPSAQAVCVTGEVTHALRAEGCDASEDGTGRGTPITPVTVALRGREGGATAEMGGEVANALRSASGGGSAPFVMTTRVRRLTPTECERLQGFPDDYTAIPGAKDSPRYAALGNSMAVPCMAWIGRRIAMVDAILRNP